MSDTHEFGCPMAGCRKWSAVMASRLCRLYLDDLQKETDALKALQSETSTELDALMPSILDKAFRGKCKLYGGNSQNRHILGSGKPSYTVEIFMGLLPARTVFWKPFCVAFGSQPVPGSASVSRTVERRA
jgi:hypothetical protein